MSNEEAVERIKHLIVLLKSPRMIMPYCKEELQALDLAIKALEKDEWIPVSERPPKESLNSVIGWDAYREKCVFVQYIDGHFQITGKDESFNIVAWMPRPKPYKEADHD